LAYVGYLHTLIHDLIHGAHLDDAGGFRGEYSNVAVVAVSIVMVITAGFEVPK
jgi:hypothetical protein